MINIINIINIMSANVTLCMTYTNIANFQHQTCILTTCDKIVTQCTCNIQTYYLVSHEQQSVHKMHGALRVNSSTIKLYKSKVKKWTQKIFVNVIEISVYTWTLLSTWPPTPGGLGFAYVLQGGLRTNPALGGCLRPPAHQTSVVEFLDHRTPLCDPRPCKRPLS